jgi:hypothetical protein
MSAIELIVGASGLPSGLDDSTASRIGELLGIMLVPRAPKSAILGRARAEALGPEAMAAVDAMADRFPRVMSHVDSFRPIVNEGREVRGAMEPTDAIEFRRTPHDPERVFINRMAKEPVASLRLNRMESKEEAVKTLAHELTHVGQRLRAIDRARRHGTVEASRVGRTDAAGDYDTYFNHPREVQARIAGVNQYAREFAEAPSEHGGAALKLKAATIMAPSQHYGGAPMRDVQAGLRANMKIIRSQEGTVGKMADIADKVMAAHGQGPDDAAKHLRLIYAKASDNDIQAAVQLAIKRRPPQIAR